MIDELYIYTLYSYANKPNESPLRKTLLALLLGEFGYLSSPSRSCLGRLIFIHGGQGWGGGRWWLWVELSPQIKVYNKYLWVHK